MRGTFVVTRHFIISRMLPDALMSRCVWVHGVSKSRFLSHAVRSLDGQSSYIDDLLARVPATSRLSLDGLIQATSNR